MLIKAAPVLKGQLAAPLMGFPRMRQIFIPLAAVAALAAGPSLAQQAYPAHHAETAAAPAAESKATPDAAPTHEMCKAMMGKQMDPKAVHEHSREKGGPVMWPNGKPLTKAEMQKMHQQCAAKMAAEPAK